MEHKYKLSSRMLEATLDLISYIAKVSALLGRRLELRSSVGQGSGGSEYLNAIVESWLILDSVLINYT